MSTFFMFGKFSSESVKKISEDWARKVVDIAEQFDGEIVAMYDVLGAYDVVLIGKYYNMEQALQASVNMSRTIGISFSTMPAIPVEEFDRLMARKP